MDNPIDRIIFQLRSEPSLTTDSISAKLNTPLSIVRRVLTDNEGTLFVIDGTGHWKVRLRVVDAQIVAAKLAYAKPTAPEKSDNNNDLSKQHSKKRRGEKRRLRHKRNHRLGKSGTDSHIPGLDSIDEQNSSTIHLRYDSLTKGRRKSDEYKGAESLYYWNDPNFKKIDSGSSEN